MHKNAEVIEKFYQAFQTRNYVDMMACYHEQIEFQDPAFHLKGKEAGAMWHMLCEQALALKIEFSGVEADDTTGKAHWEAYYPFSLTKREVHNIIDASFEFKEGKIIKHTDVFDFWRWSRQALGVPGLALGLSSFLQNKVRQQAGKNLKKFMAKHPEYQITE